MSPKEGGIKLHSDQRIFMRCGARFFSEYGCFPRGWGKCIVGNSFLYTSDGLKEIGEYFHYRDDDIETEYYDFNLDVINRNGKPAKSHYGIYSGYKPTKKVVTWEGYYLEGTYTHPILVLDSDGTVDFKNLSDVKIGDYVAISRKNNLYGNKIDIDYNTELTEWMKSFLGSSLANAGVRPMPVKLDPEISYLFGLFISGRYSPEENSIIFSNRDVGIVSRYQNMIWKYFGVTAERRSYCDYIFDDKIVKKYLELCGLVYTDPYIKTIPSCILQTTRENISAFLSGLFDVDGNVEDSLLSYCTASKKMAEQLHLLLLQFGIISKLNPYVTKSGTYCYRIEIMGDNVLLFLRHIGFRCGRKRERLIDLLRERTNSGKDIISFLSNMICKWRKAIQSENSYYFAKVIDVVSSMNHVYDLNVPDTNSFVSNGFISHNTFCEAATMFITAIRYPNIEIGLTAQTKENAASLLKDKYNELVRYYPMLLNEIKKTSFIKGDALIIFKNNARIDALANLQSSKGQRRKRLSIEESNLMNNTIFEDALEPIVEVGRITTGKLAIINPEELNQQINFYTTPGFRGSDEYQRSLQMIEDMRNLKGKIVLGSDWMLGCWYGRGSSKNMILKKKKDFSPIAFDMNYGGKWVGSATGALVNINRLMDCRTLTDPILMSSNDDDEFYLAMDVARSQNRTNNQSSIAVGQVIRNNEGKIEFINLVNMIHVSNMLNFATQACIVKKIRKRYCAKVVVVDGNGLGTGLIDELMKETYDPRSGEVYPAWDTINTTAQPETLKAEKCLYDLKAQSAQTTIISNFIDMIDSGKFRFLECRNGGDYAIKDGDDLNSKVMPFVQEELFFQETGNLKLIQNGKNLSVEKVVNKIDKDRFSAVAYLLYYIIKVADENNRKNSFDAKSFAKKLQTLNRKPKMY